MRLAQEHEVWNVVWESRKPGESDWYYLALFVASSEVSPARRRWRAVLSRKTPSGWVARKREHWPLTAAAYEMARTRLRAWAEAHGGYEGCAPPEDVATTLRNAVGLPAEVRNGLLQALTGVAAPACRDYTVLIGGCAGAGAFDFD